MLKNSKEELEKLSKFNFIVIILTSVVGFANSLYTQNYLNTLAFLMIAIIALLARLEAKYDSSAIKVLKTIILASVIILIGVITYRLFYSL